MSKEMSVKKDLKCIFNMPEKISCDEEEEYHGLPPYAPSNTYSVDKYDACPNNWMHGSDIASSYFVGVKEDHGMWLDFNECFYHTHDVAIVISIQGINPITGQKMVESTALKLEQYHKKCPIHNVNFKQDRFCEKCSFEWPGQNYLATTGTPEMMMWLDGFRTPEGKVRQYIFTKDKMRGVASQLIGDKRVFAIGIAYYLSKNKKPYTLKRPEKRENNINLDINHIYQHPMFFSPLPAPGSWNSAGMKPRMTSTTQDFSANVNIINSLDDGDGVDIDFNNIEPNQKTTIITHHALGHSAQPTTSVKKFEIGAGALIKQRIYDDPKMISYWEDKPAGMIYINYCDEETKKKILDSGKRADEKDGFMKNIKIGS